MDRMIRVQPQNFWESNFTDFGSNTQECKIKFKINIYIVVSSVFVSYILFFRGKILPLKDI